MPLTSTDRRPASSARRRRLRAHTARTLAVLGGMTHVVAAFLPWDAAGRSALDLGLMSLGERSDQPTVAIVLVAAAAVVAVPALLRAGTAPPLLSAVLVGALGLTWLAAGPVTGVPTGVAVALGAVVVLLLSAAAARGTGGTRATPATSELNGPDHVAPGFELRDHTADIAFAAWGPTRAACFGQAVRALVASFAEVEETVPSRGHGVALEPAGDEDLLVDLLGEVIYLLDARRELAVGGSLRDRADGGLEGTVEVVPLDEVRQTGAVPKAVTYHGLRVGRDGDGPWRCHVTIDV